MKLTFLGTGTSQGVPVIGSNSPVSKSTDFKDKRSRTSALICSKGKYILIDCSPDFRNQMLQHNITHLDCILFTHEHADHTAGIDDIRPFVFRQGAIPIYAQSRVIDSLKKRFSYIFDNENPYPGVPRVVVNTISDSHFFIENQEVTPVNVMHGNLPILGYRIGDIAYVTDAKYIEASEIEKIKRVKLLVINCLRDKKEHHSHFILPEVLEIIEKIEPRMAYLTHISEDFGFHQDAEKLLPQNVFLAYDGLTIEI